MKTLSRLFLSAFFLLALVAVQPAVTHAQTACNVGSNIIPCSGFILGQENAGALGTFTGSEEWMALGKAPFPAPSGDIPYGQRMQRNLTTALWQIERRSGLVPSSPPWDVNMRFGTVRTEKEIPTLARMDFDYIFQDQTTTIPTVSTTNIMTMAGAFSKQFSAGGPIAICATTGGPCFGRVGIENVNPSFTLDVNGLVRASGLILTSDARFKENINTLENSLDLIKRLRGTTYTFRNSEDLENFDFGPGQKIGFIAQEVEEVLPDLVFTDDDGYKAVDYASLIPVLVEAIKDLSAEVEALQAGNAAPASGKGATGATDLNEFAPASLFQNVPNPFNTETEIRYFLPENVRNASLLVFDMNGKQIRSIALNSRGNDSVRIGANELGAGMYLYSLIADGEEIATKRMILTQ